MKKNLKYLLVGIGTSLILPTLTHAATMSLDDEKINGNTATYSLNYTGAEGDSNSIKFDININTNVGIKVSKDASMSGQCSESGCYLDMPTTYVAGEKIKIADITLTNTLVIEKDATINLNNSTLNCGNSTLFINNGKVTINGEEEGKITSQATTAIEINDGTLTINGGDIETTQWGIDVKGTGKVIFNNGTITSQEGCITPWNYSSVVINGGTLASKDNYVIGTNGRSTETGKTKYITINGGTLIGRKPVTAGYISCGIYSPNAGKVVLNGGKILSEAGCGILMRAGSVECNGTLIETKGNEEGWVGDSKQKVNCAGIVYDSLSNYPDKKTLKLKIGRNTEIKAENKKDIELYLAEGDQANIIDDRR